PSLARRTTSLINSLADQGFAKAVLGVDPLSAVGTAGHHTMASPCLLDDARGDQMKFCGLVFIQLPDCRAVLPLMLLPEVGQGIQGPIGGHLHPTVATGDRLPVVVQLDPNMATGLRVEAVNTTLAGDTEIANLHNVTHAPPPA